MNRHRAGYILMILIIIASGFLSLSHFFNVRTAHDILDINKFPMKVGSWQGSNLEITEQEYKILETRNLISRDYVNPANKDRLNLFIIYSETNRSVFHPPEVCLIGSGIEIRDKVTEEIKVNDKDFSVNKLYLGKDDNKYIALYCYNAGRLYTDNFYLQQVYFTINQILNKRNGGATVRVMMPVKSSEEETIEELKVFMKDSIKIIEELKRKK